jgi:hypothetical protein
MKLELYLISPYEEYAKKHACRKHWNYQWGGRRGSPFEGSNAKIRLRKESFGGLLKNSDGKLYKVDVSGYNAVRLFMNGNSPEEITNELDVGKKEADNFFRDLELLGISS